MDRRKFLHNSLTLGTGLTIAPLILSSACSERKSPQVGSKTP